MNSLRYRTITDNPISPPHNSLHILPAIQLKPKKQLSIGSRYSQASSLTKSIGMLSENMAISSDSYASRRAGKLLIAFSSVTRMLTACVLGANNAVHQEKKTCLISTYYNLSLLF